MKTRLPLAVALLLPLTAMAQIYEYKDAAGRTVYTDQPPVGTAIKSRTVAREAASDAGAPGQAAAPVPKTAVDREMEFRKRQKEQSEAAAKSDKEAADAAKRRLACEESKRNLELFESGERVATRDEKGERAFLDDAQRATELAKARKSVAELCK